MQTVAQSEKDVYLFCSYIYIYRFICSTCARIYDPRIHLYVPLPLTLSLFQRERATSNIFMQLAFNLAAPCNLYMYACKHKPDTIYII